MTTNVGRQEGFVESCHKFIGNTRHFEAVFHVRVNVAMGPGRQYRIESGEWKSYSARIISSRLSQIVLENWGFWVFVK